MLSGSFRRVILIFHPGEIGQKVGVSGLRCLESLVIRDVRIRRIRIFGFPCIISCLRPLDGGRLGVEVLLCNSVPIRLPLSLKPHRQRWRPNAPTPNTGSIPSTSMSDSRVDNPRDAMRFFSSNTPPINITVLACPFETDQSSYEVIIAYQCSKHYTAIVTTFVTLLYASRQKQKNPPIIFEIYTKVI